MLGITQAQTFTVGDIEYTVTDATEKTVETTNYLGSSTTVTLPATVNDGTTTYDVTRVGNYAFHNNNLTSVTLPEGLTYIGTNAFYSNGLTSVTLPNSVVYIGSYAFYNNKLTSVTLPEGLNRIDAGVFQYNNISSVTLPEGLNRIEAGAFRDNKLSSVTLPEGLTHIGGNAFQNNNISSVTLPKGLTHIGGNAFNTNPVTSVVSSSTQPPTLLATVFDDFTAIDLFIPPGTATAYANAGWTGFKTVTEDVNLSTNGLSKEALLLELTKEQLHVSYGQEIITQIRVIDVTGRIVAMNSGARVAIAHLPAGLYIAVCKTQKGEITKKFVK